MDYELILKKADKVYQKLIEFLSKEENLKEIPKVVGVSVASYYILNKLYVGFFGPLSHLPGPFYTRFFIIPRIIIDSPRGTAYQKIKLVHEKYGNIVRFGPDTVLIADKDLVKNVLSTNVLSKGPIYKVFQGHRDATLFTAIDKDWHKNRRRIVSPAFSIRYLNSLEPYMKSCTKALIKKIDSEIEETKKEDGFGQVDLWSLLQRLALDVIGETAFGETFHMIEHNDHFIPGAISKSLYMSAVTASLPFLSKFILFNVKSPEAEMKAFMEQIVKKRESQAENRRDDILQYLIDCQKSKDENDRLTISAIMDETILFLIAGSDTTSNSTGFVFYELLRHPEKLKKLYEEIDTVELTEDKMILHDRVKNLPYLNAVINETLRLNPVAAGTLNRITDKTTVLGNLVLPKKTNVLINMYHLQTSVSYWHNPYEFIPERWTENPHDDVLEAYAAFSLGPRNCIGKNFAYQEMRLAISIILKNYDLQAIPSELEDAKIRRQFVTNTIAKNSFSVRIKRRN